MLVYYAVLDIGCFGDYLDATPHAKTTRVNVITTFLLHVYQYITFNKTKWFAATRIAEVSLKSLYSRLGFNVIKDFATSTNYEKAHK